MKTFLVMARKRTMVELAAMSVMLPADLGERTLSLIYRTVSHRRNSVMVVESYVDQHQSSGPCYSISLPHLYGKNRIYITVSFDPPPSFVMVMLFTLRF